MLSLNKTESDFCPDASHPDTIREGRDLTRPFVMLEAMWRTDLIMRKGKGVDSPSSANGASHAFLAHLCTHTHKKQCLSQVWFVHTCDPSTCQVEAGGSEVLDEPGLQNSGFNTNMN